MPEARLLVALWVLLLAGCTAPDAVIVPEAAPEATREAAAPVLLAVPDAAPSPPLPIEVSLSQDWLKPFGSVDAAATARAGARLAWFVEHEEVEPRVTVLDGEVYVLKSTTPDRHAPDTKRPHADLDGFAPDGRARAMRIEVPGRYVLEAGDARLVVNVWPDAPLDAPSQAFLVEDTGGLRFEPAQLDLATGARLLLWNQAARAPDLREAHFAAYLPLPAHGGRLTPIDEGLYHLVVVARDTAGARGIAREPFLVDFERPSERLSVGPATGRFLAAEGGAEEPDRIAFGAQHPLRSLVVRFNASTLAPVPGSVSVTLLHEGEPLASASTLTTAELLFDALPAGSYALVIAPEHGVAVSYEVTAEGRYVLPTPPRLRAAMT